MRPFRDLAIVGSGASAIYLLHHIASSIGELSGVLKSITIFERTSLAGYGMPYHPETTDIYNMSNISSEEIPALPESFVDWLGRTDGGLLRAWNIDPAEVSPSEVYGRLPLGAYLHAQYQTLVGRIAAAGVPVRETTASNVVDIVPDEEGSRYRIETSKGERATFDSVVIATGHTWSEEDDPLHGYYGSPWPISKILPQDGTHDCVTVGTLGASLSAFDVVSSLAHRHGEFRREGKRLTYHPSPGTEGFALVMHSLDGSLPHLQFDQVEPLRVIYRHVDREGMLALRDAKGFLRLSTYFDAVCRPALIDAFTKDDQKLIARKLSSPTFTLEDFVELMSERHDYDDAFAGMREEMKVARRSVENHQPIHWMEAIDDLLYTLNFHAELLPAEDHLVLKSVVMPFVMSVIAAMPLPSANMLLALREAGKLEIVAGRATVESAPREGDVTVVKVEDGDTTREVSYGLFIDCSGQRALELDQYPFPSLVQTKKVRKARAPFLSDARYRELQEEGDNPHLFEDSTGRFLHTGGVDIDAAYRLIGASGDADPALYDLAFPHTSGVRPYSYGLQACNATAEIVVGAWLEAIEEHEEVDGGLVEATDRYTEI